jgi:hypothetical protein
MTPITLPVFVVINTVFSLLSFPMIVGILIYRYKEHAVLHIVIQDANNGGMHQLRDGVRFLLEVFGLFADEMGMQHLDGRLQLQSHMLPYIHFRLA